MTGVYRHGGKRLVDLVGALALLIALAPVMAVVAIGIACSLGSPVLFRQARPGQRGRLFTLLKFRTMSAARGPDGEYLPDDRRLTRIGRFLRATSLDELPELLNVFRGEMSLVGPRPLLAEYLERYTPHDARRHEARPGITGWAQVHGRNALAWERRFALDVWYVDHLTFLLDVRILLTTVRQVIAREGICEPGTATARKYMGAR